MPLSSSRSKLYRFFVLLFLLCGGFVLTNCNQSSGDEESQDKRVNIKNRNQLKAPLGDSITVEFSSESNIEKCTFFFQGKAIKTAENLPGTTRLELSTTYFGIGKHFVELELQVDGFESKEAIEIHVLSTRKPKVLQAKKIAEFSHLSSSFTQGLEFYQNYLFEGTGDPMNNGGTKILKVELASGNPVKTISGKQGDFGEGITVFNDKIYQLTWQQQTCYVYDVHTFEKLDEFSFSGEGWGLANDGSRLIMSDGSQNIYFRDPSTFEIIEQIQVSTDVSAVTFLNELEYVEGKLYANVWTKDLLVEIDPKTGEVNSIIDCKSLRTSISGLDYSGIRQRPEVLNGIAYNAQKNTFYVTGKYWPRLYEVEFEEIGK